MGRAFATILEAELFEAFEGLEDPRSRECPHPLDEILFVALCATLSGAESFAGMAHWGQCQEKWLRQFLPLEHGVPSHDTIDRVFARLDPARFGACFIEWMRRLCPELEAAAGDEQIAIDGKSVRRGYGPEGVPPHLVSAWCARLGLCLGQLKTPAKSNEITAIPALLAQLDVRGAVVTLDAIGCQHAIAEQIVEGGGDYVLAVKDNQPMLAEALREWFGAMDRLDRPFWEWRDLDKGHGRVETRRCVVSNDIEWLAKQGCAWRGLTSVAMVEGTREFVNGKRHGEVTVERRYYISSLEADPKRLGELVRGHWHIENRLHWVLDVAFGEDESRVRIGHGAENFALLRRMAINLLRRAPGGKRDGPTVKRRHAMWDTDYLKIVLGLATP
jgi:predicted transposase YbfD/YdcC